MSLDPRKPYLVTGDTLNRLAVSAGEGLQEHRTPRGRVLSVRPGAAGGWFPFRTTVANGTVYVERGGFIYNPPSGNTTFTAVAAASSPGSDSPWLVIPGTTDGSGVFTPIGTPSVEFYPSAPTNTDSAKHAKIATISGSQVHQILTENFFFRRRLAGGAPACSEDEATGQEFISEAGLYRQSAAQVLVFGGVFDGAIGDMSQTEIDGGYPTTPNGWVVGVAWLCSPIDTEALDDRGRLDALLSRLIAIHGSYSPSFTLHEAREYLDGGSGGWLLWARDLSPGRYRISHSPFTPEDQTRLEMSII